MGSTGSHTPDSSVWGASDVLGTSVAAAAAQKGGEQVSASRGEERAWSPYLDSRPRPPHSPTNRRPRPRSPHRRPTSRCRLCTTSGSWLSSSTTRRHRRRSQGSRHPRRRRRPSAHRLPRTPHHRLSGARTPYMSSGSSWSSSSTHRRSRRRLRDSEEMVSRWAGGPSWACKYAASAAGKGSRVDYRVVGADNTWKYTWNNRNQERCGAVRLVHAINLLTRAVVCARWAGVHAGGA